MRMQARIVGRSQTTLPVEQAELMGCPLAILAIHSLLIFGTSIAI